MRKVLLTSLLASVTLFPAVCPPTRVRNLDTIMRPRSYPKNSKARFLPLRPGTVGRYRSTN